MPFLNVAHRILTHKIVYCGPSCSGKTHNVRFLERTVKPGSRGKLISLGSQETDRTDGFFDMLPLTLGEHGGLKLVFHVYTVGGLPVHRPSRLHLLKEADGFVFVADSQRSALDANLASLEDLNDNLRAWCLSLDQFPLVFQYGKRDLPDVMSVNELDAALNPRGLPAFEACALTGQGVLDTVKAIAKRVMLEPKDPARPPRRWRHRSAVLGRVDAAPRPAPQPPQLPDPVTFFDTLPQSRFAGRYVCLRLLGSPTVGTPSRSSQPEPTMSTVWAARDYGAVGWPKPTVALKIVDLDLHRDAAWILEREPQVMKHLKEKVTAMPRLLDCGHCDSQFYFAMELLEGRNLSRRLAEGPLDVGELRRLCRRLGDQLAVFHDEGVVHRDVKPANILTTQAGATIIDFGIAGVEPGAPVAAHIKEVLGAPLALTLGGGTPAYMSPEQHAVQRVDEHADLWAFAVVLYEALTGEHPFDMKPPSAPWKAPAARPPYDKFFAQAFAPLMMDRFHSADELTRAFADAIAEANPPPPPTYIDQLIAETLGLFAPATDEADGSPLEPTGGYVDLAGLADLEEPIDE